MKIVRFMNGKFAVRKFSLLHMGWVYRDLKDPKYWWERKNNAFQDCQSEDIKVVTEVLDKMMDPGKPV